MANPLVISTDDKAWYSHNVLGSPLTTTGDLLVETAQGTEGRLAIGTNGQALTVTAGTPAWAAVSLLSTSPTAGIGYATGAGGTVTQATSKSTGVTLNKVSGQITMNGAALLAGTTVGFTLTNSTVAATDVVVVSIASGASANSYRLEVTATAAGSCRIEIGNTLITTLSEAIVLNYVVIKGVLS